MIRDSRFKVRALRFEQLEDRSVPATGLVTANSFSGGIFAPFEDFSGQVNTTSGDVTGDGVDDIITAHGLGAGSASRVRIYDGAALRGQTQAVIVADFFAYSDSPGASPNPGFAGGVFVASADFDGDGADELVTSTGAGGFGHLKVFSFRNSFGQFTGSNPILRTSFYAYPGFLGDIRVETVERAGLPPLLVTASGAGTTLSDIRVYANPLSFGSVPIGVLVPPDAQTFVFPGYLGGVTLATGDTNLDGVDELFVAPVTGTPVISVFSLVAPGPNGFNSLTPIGTGGFPQFPGTLLQTGAASAAFGLFPVTTFVSGPAPQADIRLGSVDVNNDGRDEILTSFVNPGFNSPISVFSLNLGTAGVSQLPSISGFQGFGFFGFLGGEWLASSTFTSPGGITGATFTTPGLTLNTSSTLLNFGTSSATAGGASLTFGTTGANFTTGNPTFGSTPTTFGTTTAPFGTTSATGAGAALTFGGASTPAQTPTTGFFTTPTSTLGPGLIF
jgi:hypothetical protein